MAIVVQCTCGKRLSAKEELRGKRVKCPACQQLLTVPAANDAAATWQPVHAEQPSDRYQMEGEVPGTKPAKSRAQRIEASIKKRKKAQTDHLG